MMRKQLLLGTSNLAKIECYKKFLNDVDIEILTLDDVNVVGEPAETGKTFEENAKIKALYYLKKTGIPTLSDDAGFEIPALNNFPGIKSRRFESGKWLSDEEVINGILTRMRELRGSKREAKMRIVTALALPSGEIHTASGKISGTVPEIPYEKREKNFPYRSLLFISKLNKWFYELTEQEEKQLGYRKDAVTKLKKYLQ